MAKSRVLLMVAVICKAGALAGGLPAQTPPRPAFEVASVKHHRSGDIEQDFATTPDGSFRLTNATARMFIRQAYRLQDFQILDAPPWTELDRFDVRARAPRGATTAALPGMLQSLLQERFRLLAHREMRDMPIYALAMNRRDGALGPNLRRTPPEASAVCAAQRASRDAPPRSDGRLCGIGITGGSVRAGDATLGQLLGLLSPVVGRTSIDKTRLAGTFDYELNWSAEQLSAPPAASDAPSERAINPNGASVFTALQEQLGLKLESTKGPVEVLVIDHIERPTEG
jgi:uncharacterized protein (TIGR03435 family)